MITLLDGPIGTQLAARGVATRLPLWSAAAIDEAPEILAAIHRDYASAGATVHTTNTFRTQPKYAGNRWKNLVQQAVRIARSSVDAKHRVAGSMAPVEDCYRPDLSPPNAETTHRQVAEELAAAGCDLLLCETFPHSDEAVIAARCALATGLETWVSLTAGPSADLMRPDEMAQTAQRLAELGVAAVLVNCTAADQTLRYVERIATCGLSISLGAYANAGTPDSEVGWQASTNDSVVAYGRFAESWRQAGATIIGGCCGTGPGHIRQLHSLFHRSENAGR